MLRDGAGMILGGSAMMPSSQTVVCVADSPANNADNCMPDQLEDEVPSVKRKKWPPQAM